MRLFAAIHFPEISLAPLRDAQRPLRRALEKAGAQLRWVDPRNWHLTLKFIGECPEAAAPEMAQALRAAAGAIPVFTVQWAGYGFFPPRGSPAVLWISLNEDSGALQALADRMQGVFEEAGIPRDSRAFRAHLTLARLKRCLQPESTRASLAALSPPAIPPSPIQTVELMQSILHPHGPEYRVVESVKLEPR